ncbi:MAG: hypothetical protein LR015_01440 [Verrucomicrobia bacterium]|nr:hypothetical protein [Verrucomicrobiota bacterium]
MQEAIAAANAANFLKVAKNDIILITPDAIFAQAYLDIEGIVARKRTGNNVFADIDTRDDDIEKNCRGDPSQRRSDHCCCIRVE